MTDRSDSPPNEVQLNSFEQEKRWALRPHVDENGAESAILYQASAGKPPTVGYYMAHLPMDSEELRGLSVVIGEFCSPRG